MAGRRRSTNNWHAPAFTPARGTTSAGQAMTCRPPGCAYSRDRGHHRGWQANAVEPSHDWPPLVCARTRWLSAPPLDALRPRCVACCTATRPGADALEGRRFGVQARASIRRFGLNRATDKRCQEFAASAPEPPRLCALLVRRRVREGMTMSYVDVAIPAIAGLLALAWPQMFLRKPADEHKVRRIRLFGLLFLAIAAAYLAMRLAGV